MSIRTRSKGWAAIAEQGHVEIFSAGVELRSWVTGPRAASFSQLVREMRAIYKARRDVLVESMARAGWDIPSPPASMFAWAPIPESHREAGSLEFAKQLLIHAKVAVAPGLGFGEYGEGYVRIALVENEHRIRQAARNVKKFLSMRSNEHPRVPDMAK